MKRLILLLPAFAGLSVFYTACTKQPVDNLSDADSRIYITDQDSSANFTAYKTFSIPDSVAVIKNGRSVKELNSVDSAYIAAATKYMELAGYSLVSSKENPDLGVDVNKIISTSSGIISYDDYWNDYSGYWDPYYWGYPDYGYYIPYAYSVYQIREGAMSLDILDLKNANADKKINILWTGLIRGSGIFDPTIADSQVQALFNQSTYLKAN